jgi:hypothetical protein
MSACSRCGTPFRCAMTDPDPGGAPCWCTQLPAVLPVPEAAGCYCPACLREAIQEREQAAD